MRQVVKTSPRTHEVFFLVFACKAKHDFLGLQLTVNPLSGCFPPETFFF